MSENTTQEGSAPSDVSTGKTAVAISAGLGGYVGVKAGMTQIYGNDGELIAVTVIDLQPNTITQVKTQATDGYTAVQVGVLEKKAKRATKAAVGHAKKSGKEAFYSMQEFRLPEGSKTDGLTVGADLSIDFVKEGDLVDLTAISKGKGFQGGMKRFHMAGGYATHGQSVTHRSLGSIGNRADPGKTFKNKKMPGQMGNVRRTVQSIRVAKIDLENGVLLVAGSVPGPRSGLVTIRKAVKSVKRG
jgi:large subunit ribosomal protein L3